MKPSAKGSGVDDCVHEAVRQRIDGCSYKSVFDKVTWHYDEGHLTLRGCVPSFHLKQLLQELLRGMEQVTHITNSVDVVSSLGEVSEQIHESG